MVPSVFASDPDAVTAAFANPILAASEQVVVKPTVSAGSKNTGLFRRGDPAARALADEILSLGKTVMIQPAVQSVAAVGETAMLHRRGRGAPGGARINARRQSGHPCRRRHRLADFR